MQTPWSAPGRESSPKRLSSSVRPSQQTTDADFARGAILGRGTFSTVYHGTHLASGVEFALKVIDKTIIRRMGVEESLASEINILRKTRHKHIVRLFSYYVTRSSVVLVLELCTSGSLAEFLQRQKDKRCSERTAAKIIFDVAHAVQYMHQRNIVHRDLKLENILLDEEGTAKIADFGTSRRILEARAFQCEDLDTEDVPIASRLTICGTLDYLSPEMLQREPQTIAVDLWALGAITAELLTGHPPFYHESQQRTMSAIVEDDPDLSVALTQHGSPAGVSPVRLQNTLSPKAVDFVRRLLNKDPRQRLSIDEVLLHPWLRANVW